VSKLNQWIDQFPEFHALPPTEQIVRLAYFSEVEDAQETTPRQRFSALFDTIGVEQPANLAQMLTYLAGRGKRLLKRDGGYSLRREVRQAIREELERFSGIQSAASRLVPAFEFPGQSFIDGKVRTLLAEAKKSYATECWNACGILVRIIIERTLDSVDPKIKGIQGLRDKLNYCVSNPGQFSKSIIEGLKELKGAKLVGDIVAHHSSITLDKHDVDVVIPPFRMLLKEVLAN